MPQFDVFRTRGSASYPLVVDVQADVHTILATRIVVPMLALARAPTPRHTRLTPMVRILGEEYVLMFPLMSSLQRSSLGALVGSLAADRQAMIAAIDLLIAGS